MKSSKSRRQRSHAKRRALTRIGVSLHEDFRRRIIRLIQDGQAPLVEKQSCRVSVFRISVEDKPVNVVYDRRTKEIVTFLYPEISHE